MSYRFTYAQCVAEVGTFKMRVLRTIECEATLVPNQSRDGYWQAGTFRVMDGSGKWFELSQMDSLWPLLAKVVTIIPENRAACDALWFASFPRKATGEAA